MSITAIPHAPIALFVSFAHEDEVLLRELEVHLSLLRRQGIITVWHDQQIVAGTNKAESIDEHLEQAAIILLLVSPDFLACDSCYTTQMQRVLERHHAGEANVIPIVLRPCDWSDAPFADLACLPIDGKPITTWENRDAAWNEAVLGIRHIIDPTTNVPEREAPTREPAGTRTNCKGPVQGQVTGDGNTVYQYFGLTSSPASVPATPSKPIWNVPYPRNPFFTGRVELLTQLAATLRSGQPTALSQPQAISGLGGIGKTQIAIEYAYQYEKDYQAVLWVQANTRENLTSSFLALAALLNLPEKDASESDLVVAVVKQWLRITTGYLLILDNADDLKLTRDFLLPKMSGHVLLTTRVQATGRFARRLEVDELPVEQGMLFLLRRASLLAPDAPIEQASEDDQCVAKDICEELGGLPLALDQAGAYIEETGCGLVRYRQRYQQHRGIVLAERRDELVNDHPLSVAATWKLSFEQVELQCPAAADLLRVCAFLAPDAIPETIITEGASHLGPQLATVGANADALDQAIEALRGYSLVRREVSNGAAHMLSVHRLVQAVLHDSMPVAARQQWKRRAVLAVNANRPDVQNVEQWNTCEQWLPHARLCVEWIKQEQIVSVEAANVLLGIGRYVHERGEYEEVEEWYRSCLSIRESILGPDDLSVADVLCHLANLFSEQGKYEEAEPLYQRSLKIRESFLGPDDLEVASVLNNLAILRKVGGKYEEAKQFYLRNLDIRERYQRPEHPAVAQALNNLGVLYAEYGHYEEAEPLFRRSQCIRERHLTSDHPDLAQTLGNLANLLTERGNLAEAEHLYQRGLSILKQSQGDEHPYVAYVLNGQANLFLKQGKYQEAEELFQRSWDIWKQCLDSMHPQVAYAMNNLAFLLKMQGNNGQARPLYQKSQALLADRLGIGHPHIRTNALQYADILNTHALFLQGRGDYEEAEQLYRQSLNLLIQHQGDGHPTTRVCVRNYVKLLRLLAREAEAQKIEQSHGLSEESS